MPQPSSSIELPVNSALARSFRSAEEQGKPLAVEVGDVTYAIFVERSPLREADRAAALAAAGSWKNLVDEGVLKQQLKDARTQHRHLRGDLRRHLR